MQGKAETALAIRRFPAAGSKKQSLVFLSIYPPLTNNPKIQSYDQSSDCFDYGLFKQKPL
jgi:hypothetical protein